MAVYPLIDEPCPYKGRLSDIMDNDICRLCRREVHDLTSMSDGQRRAFLKACGAEVCVSYKVAARTAVALGLLAAGAAASLPASAQTDPTQYMDVVIVGGVKKGAEAVFVEDEADKAIPELPVVYEEQPPKADSKPAAAHQGDETIK